MVFVGTQEFWREVFRARCSGRTREEGALTLAMAVSIGWGVFLLELVLLGWLLARHNR